MMINRAQFEDCEAPAEPARSEPRRHIQQPGGICRNDGWRVHAESQWRQAGFIQSDFECHERVATLPSAIPKDYSASSETTTAIAG